MTKEFEIARLAIVRAAKASEINIARGFAWAHRIYPPHATELEQAFATDFKISERKREQVWTIIDDGWRNSTPVKFYDLEGMGGGGVGLGRWELITVCRLAFLDDRFDASVWKALTGSGAPIEAKGLARKFCMEDDINY